MDGDEPVGPTFLGALLRENGVGRDDESLGFPQQARPRKATPRGFQPGVHQLGRVEAQPGVGAAVGDLAGLPHRHLTPV